MDYCSLDYQDYPTYEGLLSDGVVKLKFFIIFFITSYMLFQNFYGHSPSPYRVNVVLSNMPEFAEDFNCPAGSRLNPPQEERCAVW